MEESIKNRVSKVLKHIDMPTILFFLGIQIGRSIAERRSADRLRRLPGQKHTRSLYDRRNSTGLLSAVIDNVPLVAACMGMYPVADTTALASGLDPALCRRSYRTVSSGIC